MSYKQTLTFPRGSAFACVMLLHAALIYAIAASLGIVDIPLMHQTQAVFIPPEVMPAIPPSPIAPVRIERTVVTVDPRTPDVLLDESENRIVVSTEEPHDTSSGQGPKLVEPQPQATLATLISRSELIYPSGSRRDGEEGVVVLNLLVANNGRVQDAVVQKSSGYFRLDEAAMKNARQWKFKPSMQGGAAIASWISVPIRFQLQL